MKLLIKSVFIVLCLGVYLASCSKGYTKAEIDKMFEPIASKYGVKIVYKIDKNFAPMLFTGQRIAFDRIEPIAYQVLAKYPSILGKALKKYPERVIRKYLDAVYFAKTMETEGIKASGTCGFFIWSVYLADDGKKDDKRAERTFHHEFSTVLLRQTGFLINPWEEQNPKEFKYLYETIKNRRDIRISGKGTKSDYEDGFITDYGRTTFENDFNEYAAMIFTAPREFKKIMDQYPRVRNKFKLWLEFYHKIDPVFTEAYFFERLTREK